MKRTPDFYCPQFISSHGIDHAGYRCACLPWGKISNTHTTAVSTKGVKWKKIWFPQSNPVRKGLNKLTTQQTNRWNKMSYLSYDIIVSLLLGSCWPTFMKPPMRNDSFHNFTSRLVPVSKGYSLLWNSPIYGFTHWCSTSHTCVNEQRHRWISYQLPTCPMPSYYLNKMPISYIFL